MLEESNGLFGEGRMNNKIPETYSKDYMNMIADFYLKDPNIDLGILTGAFFRGYKAAEKNTGKVQPKRLYEDVRDFFEISEIKNKVLDLVNPYVDKIQY